MLRLCRTVSLTRQPSRARSALSKGTFDDNLETGREEMGVRGREITVVRAEPGAPSNLSKQSLSFEPGQNVGDQRRSMDSDIAPESVRSQTLQGRSSSDGAHGSESSGIASFTAQGYASPIFLVQVARIPEGSLYGIGLKLSDRIAKLLESNSQTSRRRSGMDRVT